MRTSRLALTHRLDSRSSAPRGAVAAERCVTLPRRVARLNAGGCDAARVGRRRRDGRPDAEIQAMAVLTARALRAAAAEALLAADHDDVEEVLQRVVVEERFSLVLRTWQIPWVLRFRTFRRWKKKDAAKAGARPRCLASPRCSRMRIRRADPALRGLAPVARRGGSRHAEGASDRGSLPTSATERRWR